MTSYIITGVSGFIGKNFLNQFPKTKILGIYHTTPPPTKPSELRTYLRYNLVKPLDGELFESDRSKVVIHCASYPHINKCEIERHLGTNSLAWLGNVVATQNVIDYCKKFNKKLVFLSTECVFSGEKDKYIENDKKQPKSWYGYTKSVAEDLIQNSGIEHLIIRGVVGYGQGGAGSNIIQSLIDNLVYKGRTYAVSDQRISFTYIDDLTKGVLKLIQKKASGIYHIAGKQIASPYDLAVEVCKKLDIKTSNVKPITMRQYFGVNEAKLRLKNAVLDPSKFEKLTGYKTTNLKNGINQIFIRK